MSKIPENNKPSSMEGIQTHQTTGTKRTVEESNSTSETPLEERDTKKVKIAHSEAEIQALKDFLKRYQIEGDFNDITEIVLCEEELKDEDVKILFDTLDLFENLESLDLTNNQITFLPSKIGCLKELTELLLFNNNLKTLPDEIADLKKLTVLDLGNNDMGLLPEVFFRLTQIVDLDISRNNLKTLDPRIGLFTGLQRLQMIDNGFTDLPTEISCLQELYELHISGNDFLRLPIVLCDLLKLKEFHAESCHISELPTQISQLKELTFISLFDNSLTTLPAELIYLVNLKQLDLRGNAITELPIEIGKLNVDIINIEISDYANLNSLLRVIRSPETRKEMRNGLIDALRETNNNHFQEVAAKLDDYFNPIVLNTEELKKLNLAGISAMLADPLEILSDQEDGQFLSRFDAFIQAAGLDEKTMKKYVGPLYQTLDNLFNGAAHKLSWVMHDENMHELKNAFRHILKRFKELKTDGDKAGEIAASALLLIDGLEYCASRQASEINQVVLRLLNKKVSEDAVENGLEKKLTQMIIDMKQEAFDRLIKEDENTSDVHHYQRIFTVIKNEFGIWSAMQGFDERISIITKTDRAEIINKYLNYFNANFIVEKLGSFLKNKCKPKDVHSFCMIHNQTKNNGSVKSLEMFDWDEGALELQAITGNKNIYEYQEDYPVTDQEVLYILTEILKVISSDALTQVDSNAAEIWLKEVSK